MSKIIHLIFFLVLLFSPFLIEAVTLSLEPDVLDYRAEDIFIVEIKINPGEECINVVGLELSYPGEILEGLKFNEANSIISLWAEKPSFRDGEGTLYFSGGIPGGYCGEEKPVLLGEAVFKARKVGWEVRREMTITENSMVFLNDGMATQAETEKQGAEVIIRPERRITPYDLWRMRVEEDQTPPKSFTPEIRRDPNLFDGKYFLVFSTTDENTGIDYYMVSEQRRIGFATLGDKIWVRADSPYVLQDQSLSSMISVKAVDRAGNERVETVKPPMGGWDIIAYVTLFLAIVIPFWIWRKRIKEETKKLEEI